MRRYIALTAIFAAIALVFAAGAPAYADPGNGNGNGQGNPPGNAGGNKGNGGNNGGGGSDSNGPPGFNGTVKIHDGDSEAEPIRRNEPHVGCSFHIHGFNFDPSARGTWSIQSWPPTGDRSVVASGTWGPADGEGDWRTAVMSLPGGDHQQGAHYKLNVDQTDPSAPGGEKHKVFWVDCQTSAGGGNGGGGNAGGGENAGGGGNAGGENAGGDQQQNAGGQQQNVAGAQQGPRVAGQQSAPVTSLPSTSTDR